MRGARTLLLPLLALLAGPVSAEGGGDDAQGSVLGNLIRWFVHEETPTRREELLEAIERKTGGECGPVADAIRRGEHFRRPERAELAVGGPLPVFSLDEPRIRPVADAAGDLATLELPRDYTRDRDWPLLLDLGPGRFPVPPDAVVLRIRPEAHAQAREEVWAAEALVLSLLAHVLDVVALDPDRVVLRAQEGYAALAWYVALHNPDRFAGVLTSDGSWAQAERIADNARGFEALAFEPRRGDRTLRRLFEGLDEERHRLVKLPRNPAEDEQFRPVIDAFRAAALRRPPPYRVQLEVDRALRLRAYWLQATPKGNSQRQEPIHPRLTQKTVRVLNNVARIDAVIDAQVANLVQVTAENLTSFDLFVEAGRFDANLPLRVSINGRPPESKLIVPEIATLLEDYRERRDPRLLYVCKLHFPVR